jgi:hypothetical protein
MVPQGESILQLICGQDDDALIAEQA